MLRSMAVGPLPFPPKLLLMLFRCCCRPVLIPIFFTCGRSDLVYEDDHEDADYDDDNDYDNGSFTDDDDGDIGIFPTLS